MMDVSVEIHCGICGSANYSMPGGLADDAPLRCNDCSSPLGSIGELTKEMLEQARARSAEALRQEIDRLAEPRRPDSIA